MRRKICLAVFLAALGMGMAVSAMELLAFGTNERGADGEVSYDKTPEEKQMEEMIKYDLRPYPKTPDMPGEWLAKDMLGPYRQHGGDGYIPGHPGQTAYYPPSTNLMPLEYAPNYNRIYTGYYKAGYGHPVYYQGDEIPEEWEMTTEEKIGSTANRPHWAEECEGLDETIRASHKHIAVSQKNFGGLMQDQTGTWKVYDRSGHVVQTIEGTAPAFLQNLTPAASATDEDAFLPSTNQPLETWQDAMSNGSENQAQNRLRRALLLMGRGTLILGKALGKDTSDLTAAVNLVKQSDAREGMENLSRAISRFSYSSEDFLAIARGSDAQKRKLKFALEKAEECKKTSNKLILQGAFYALGDRSGSWGEYDGIVGELKAAYSAFTEKTRTAKQILDPSSLKEDSGKTKKLAKSAEDGGLEF